MTIVTMQGMAGGLSVQRITSVHRRFAAFCSDVGREEPTGLHFDPDLIEAFVVSGLPGRRSSTKGTYRSVLVRAVPEKDRPGSRGTPFPGSVASVPYTGEERRGLLSMAAAQRKATTRRSALGVLAAGLGAGLAAGELIGLRGPHVVSIDGDVVVNVAGPRSRVVPVVPSWGAVILTLAEQAGNEFLFHPGPADRSYKNFVNNFCRHLVADPALPRLSAGRGRSSFICDHLAGGTALSEILLLTGIEEVESLARYARHVEAMTSSKAALRRRLDSEARR
ncbi:MAG: hypothetical protein ACYCV7_15815 [Acidimicrobiales bacterium]